jgi:hypothetical protein
LPAAIGITSPDPVVCRHSYCRESPRRATFFCERGGFPRRVHVAEDYDTDIERRWWMAGKAETKNLPPGDLEIVPHKGYF